LVNSGTVVLFHDGAVLLNGIAEEEIPLLLNNLLTNRTRDTLPRNKNLPLTVHATHGELPVVEKKGVLKWYIALKY
jgi:hypothetical protein